MKINSVITAFLILGSITLYSCGAEKSEKTGGSHEYHEHVSEYQCPMKCEGDKTYKESGKCPVCKMDLKELEHEH